MGQKVAAVVMIMIGAGAALWALQIGYGSLIAPGPGFLPFWLSLALVFVSVLYFFQTLSNPKSEPLWAPGAWQRPLKSAIVILGYITALSWLGFASASFLLFLVWVGYIEKESRRRTILVSLIGTLCLYLVFAYLLEAPLPNGFLL